MTHYLYTHVGQPGQAAASYPTAQTAYVAAPQTAYATAAAPRAGHAYESYQTAHAAAPQYAYATRTQVAVSPSPYEQSKTYYQPAQAAAETVYPTPTRAKPAYSSSSYNAATQRQVIATPKTQSAAHVVNPASSYVYPVSTTPTVSSYAPTTTYQSTQPSPSSYETALYSAATSYYNQGRTGQTSKIGGSWSTFKNKGTPGTGGSTFNRIKGPPRSQQLHYCDVCKISCGGPQTYKEHLEGQKHKKKEIAAKESAAPTPQSRAMNQLRCELCDVTCTGTDAYAAHIRGVKHQKVVKLHTKLGKQIPSSDPIVVASKVAAAAAAAIQRAAASTTTSAPVGKPITKAAAAPQPVIKKILATPKINFVGGTKLTTLHGEAKEVKTLIQPNKPETAAAAEPAEKLNILGEKDIAPVGHDYIEEMKVGKIVSFHCKLCDCKFNDPNAKDMHMKGRRHRLQFKKKVDPTLQVDMKAGDIRPGMRGGRGGRGVRGMGPSRGGMSRDEMWRKRADSDNWLEEMSRYEEEIYWDERRRYEEEMWRRGHGFMRGRGGFGGPPPPPPPFAMRRPESSDDRHTMAKHAQIYPNEEELQSVQSIVSTCEKSLKLVSDFLTESDAPKKSDNEVKIEPGKTTDLKKEKADKNEPPTRVLKGVMRVGILAKGLLLHTDLNVHLIVLCTEKPTRTLLDRVADSLPKFMATITEETYEMKRCVEEAAIIISNDKDPQVTCTITLTSPAMRDEDQTEATPVVTKDPPDVLDRHKCLAALAALRHAKWFQARANILQSCVIVIRIFRDLCQRVPTWTPLNEWAMELLVEKCTSSVAYKMTPGDALRRVFESISSGLLLPGGHGLIDPCEKDPADAAPNLTNQQREEITASAQHALRLLSFRQIHKVLGMDKLPPPRFGRFSRLGRKRRATGSDSGEGGEKKDKKEEEEAAPAAAAATK